jgi:hypothetical protein
MLDWQSYINFPIVKENFNRQSYGKLLIVTVAFNNLQTIDLQNKFLKKYLIDDYFYLVVDNSSDIKTSRAIREYCQNNKLAYMRPFFCIYRTGSKSHGSALNWIYRFFIKNGNFRYFGFIDHDLYPAKKTSILRYIENQPIYGLLQERDEKWYLWAGFCFFDRDYLSDKHVDFFPQPGVVDTGGMNYYSLYRNMDKSGLEFPRQAYLRITDSKIVQEGNVEFLGDWLHTFNASGWLQFENASEREIKVKKILDDLLK